MSAIGGILQFDGRPIGEGALARPWESLAGYGPDGGDMVTGESVGMIYRAFHTSRESRFELQPLVSAAGQVLTWDGRLDNRRELLLDLSGHLPDCRVEIGDAAIVMAAYERWGGDCFGRIIGDFALALWDPRVKRLLLARDPFGVRSLFYHSNRERILWASDLNGLLDWAQVTPEIDDEYIAGFLTQFAEPWQTPYKGFRAVPPGSVITIELGEFRERRFWSLDPHNEVRYRTDSEYEEHFLHLFREAVSCRLRSDRPIWAELSGGFDSSSIVCLADRIIESGGANGVATAPYLETVSYIYDESPTSDEREFIHSVELQRRRAGQYIKEKEFRFVFEPEGEAPIGLPSTLHCFGERYGLLLRKMQDAGARVLLTGHGGDQLLNSNEDPLPQLADYIAECRPVHLHRHLRTWSLALREPYLKLLWKAVLLLLPRRVQACCAPAGLLPPWYNRKFIDRMHLRDRLLGPRDIFGFRLPSDRDQCIGLLSAMRFVAAGYFREFGAVEIRHPFLHRPLVEFLQAIPGQQRVRPGETRSLMRRALRDVLPERILKRKGKQGPDEALCRALAREWPRLRAIFDEARVCSYGYVDPLPLLDALNKTRQGLEANTFMLFKTISLEFWLRSLEHRRSMIKSAAGYFRPEEPATRPTAVQIDTSLSRGAHSAPVFKG